MARVNRSGVAKAMRLKLADYNVSSCSDEGTIRVSCYSEPRSFLGIPLPRSKYEVARVYVPDITGKAFQLYWKSPSREAKGKIREVLSGLVDRLESELRETG